MASRRILADFRLLKDNGDVCTDGVATIYLGGTTTPQSGYSDKNLSQDGASVKNFDAAGWPPNIFVSTAIAVKVVITGTGVTTKTLDYYAQATDALSNVFDGLTAPGADRLPFYDQSALSSAWLNLDPGLSISGTTLSLAAPIAALAGVASAANKFPIYTGSGAGDVSGFDVFSGLLFGLTLSNDSGDLTNDIGIAAGIALDSTNTALLRLAAALVKRLDANWAGGTNQGMRYSGAALSNTTYHIYLIGKADGTTDIYADPSATVATVLAHVQAEAGGASYVYARRIASIVRTSGSIRRFTQFGDTFIWAVPGAYDYASGPDPGVSAITPALSVPTGIQVEALVTVIIQDASPATATAVLVSEPDTTDTAPVAITGPVTFVTPASGASVPQSQGVQMPVRTNTSGQIRIRLSASTTDHAAIATARGYIDHRGRLQ